MIWFGTISPQEKADFTRNLAMMLKSGIPLHESLRSLAKQSRSKVLGNLILQIQKKIEVGIQLSDALSQHQRVFGPLFVNLIEAGEASGTLVENLSFLAKFLEESNDLKKEINAVTLYPKIVLGATVLLGGGLAVFLLPKLIPLFQQLEITLPLTTRMLLAFSVFIEQWWKMLALGILGIVLGVSNAAHIPLVKYFLDSLYLKTPFVGNLARDYQLALLSRLLFLLFKSGISITESLEIASHTATNKRYQTSLALMRERVLRGSPLSGIMKEHPLLYPQTVIDVVATGEQSGNLDLALEHIAEFYSHEVHNKTKQLPAILEPMLLIGIAFVVGFVALSIIMPIYQLTQGLGR